MTFGERLKQLRLDAKMNQRSVADAVGIDFTYLSKVENGKMPPPGEGTIRRLADTLRASYDELMQLAEKVPEDLKPMISQNASMPAFLRSISNFSSDDLKLLQDYAEKLKNDKDNTDVD